MSDSTSDDNAEQIEYKTEVKYETLCDNNFEPYTISISEDVTFVKKSGQSMGSSRSRIVHATRFALSSHEGTVTPTANNSVEISVVGRKPIILSRKNN